MKNVKIVFVDLDGTLTYEPKKIDIRNKTIFEKLKNIGIPVVVNTGRPIRYTASICKQFSTSNYIIASNGAEVYNYLTKKYIYKSSISKENLDILNQLIEKYSLFFLAHGTEREYSNIKEKGRIYKNKLSDIFEEDIPQVVIKSYSLNNMKLFRRDLQQLTDLKIVNKTKNVKDGTLLYYDVVNNEVTKGNAVVKLCESLNIPVEKAMAIGDGDNDIEMFEKVGYKVAVANASDKLKEKANYVTLSNKENGVALILNELYTNLTN